MSDPEQSSSPPLPPSPWNVANALTLARVLLVPVFVWLVLADNGENETFRVLAFATFALAMVTDQADGYLARRRGLITDLGSLADPIADKALTGAAFVCLSILGLLPWWATAVVLVREIGITLLRFAVVRYGVIPASRGGKVKTAVQSLALSLYILPLPATLEVVQVSAMALAVAITVVTGLDYVLQALRLTRDHAR